MRYFYLQRNNFVFNFVWSHDEWPKILKPLHKNTCVMSVVRSGRNLEVTKTVFFKMLAASQSQGFSEHEKSHIALFKKISEFVPKLTGSLHKGQCGRIGIIGGSSDYSGAPFHSAIAALRTGADLVYVFCCQNAAPVIKSYSPEVIVCPILDNDSVVRLFEPWLQRIHVLVIGPGLGRDLGVLRNAASVIAYIKERNIQLPLIIDADGLFLISEHLNLIRDYKGPIILTPNFWEFERLKAKVSSAEPLQIASELNAVIVQKGPNDVITNGIHTSKNNSKTDIATLNCDLPGSFRRVGGQGDILVGCMATFTAWFHSHVTDSKGKSLEDTMAALGNSMGYGLPAYAACAITRACSRLAFKEFGRSTIASDLIPFIHKAFKTLFGP